MPVPTSVRTSVDTRPAPGLQAAPSRIGTGVFATRDFRAGDTLLQLGGAVHPGPELDRLGYRPGYPLQVGDDLWMLLEPPGVYINHSCDPNCGIDADLRLIALRDLAAGEELSFDYSTTMHEHGAWSLDCGCGSPSCRGRIVDFVGLTPRQQAPYLRAGVVLPFILKHLEGVG